MTNEEATAARAKIQEALDYLWNVLGIPECMQVAAKLKKDAERAADALAASATPAPAPKTPPTALEAFYAHLDKCQQCREHAFDLCSEGQPLLVAAAAAAAIGKANTQ